MKSRRCQLPTDPYTRPGPEFPEPKGPIGHIFIDPVVAVSDKIETFGQAALTYGIIVIILSSELLRYPGRGKMPVYEYKCRKCGFKFENMQKFSDPILKTCPQCKEIALEKLISNSFFSLKGTGWHMTDYKKPSSPAARDNSCPTPPKSEKKTDTSCSKEA